ncbi:MAG: alpha-2-macroglobulin, partial [Acetobacteraceae bacterium]|nr:alpha-2-macroglobulin [Acetobacteraceae bacterium]
LDPLLEPTAQPRQYLVEATVTGDDDVQVRGVRRITALPPFVLGLKVPRYIPQVGAIDPDILALDGEGKPIAGLPLTVRLIHRQWNSVLQASDFAQGSARYQTQVIDETVEERQMTSAAEPVPMHFGVAEAGVYLVEVSAEDKAGRRQTVRVDLFTAGDTPVTWSRPPSQIITLTPDKDSYAPGESATVVIQSPFQTARALAVIEEPEERFRTEWVDVQNGFGRLLVPLRKQQVPRLAVHVLLMRGRLPGTLASTAPFDQGKPTTLAATKWLTVRPVEHQVRVSFEAPAQARPGEEVDLVLHLADAGGRPLAGEATVWMVDQAVLALAKEQPLDPLPSFIVDRPSRMAARDTRNMAFGVLPLQENPGGDENGDFGMENISVRKNFTPVPFYEPRVKVGPDGTARIHVKLPDTLTVYMLRAKAISGPDRFGFGTGQMRIRQPVVAQPALPRFVRPGDVFAAGLIGRIVEGPGGAGRAVLSVDGLQPQGATEQSVTWDGGRPARVDFTVAVPEPAPGTNTARVRFLLQRTADRVSDGVQIDLPIRPDRPIVHRRDLLSTGPGGLEIPAVADPIRPASYFRQVTLATDPEIPRLVAGVSALVRFPVGGTEQRIALATGELALLPFTPLIEASGLRERVGGDVAAAIAAARQSADEDGLIAFWPRTKGSVWLTAAAYRMMVAADRAGQSIDKLMAERMAKVLTAALRSDYPRLQTDYSLFERVAALTALADAGTISADYAAELARRAQSMPTGSVAEIATVLSRLPQRDERLLAEVLGVLWSRVNILSRDGKPAYGGLTDAAATAQILPSEARSLANVVQAVATAAPADPRLPVLRAGLVGLAGGQGWGNTNATAAALRALAASWQAPAAPVSATVTLPNGPVNGNLDQARPLLQASTARPGPVRVSGPAGLAVLAASDYVPAQPGAQAPAEQNGFVLTRTLFRVPASGAPMQRLDPEPDGTIRLAVGDVVEEVDELVTPADRAHVALRLPLAAGLEPLNPALATAPAEATPSAGPTVPPAWSSYGDDEVLQVWLKLPRGTAVLRTRMRATTAGSFTAPPATAEMLYQPGVTGSSSGQRLVVTR